MLAAVGAEMTVIVCLMNVSTQFLWFQISTFDKVSIPTITHLPGN